MRKETLLDLGIVFEVSLAFAISMFEMAMPWDPTEPLLGHRGVAIRLGPPFRIVASPTIRSSPAAASSIDLTFITVQITSTVLSVFFFKRWVPSYSISTHRPSATVLRFNSPFPQQVHKVFPLSGCTLGFDLPTESLAKHQYGMAQVPT